MFLTIEESPNGRPWKWIYLLFNKSGQYYIIVTQDQKDFAVQGLLLPPYKPAQVIFNAEDGAMLSLLHVTLQSSVTLSD